MGRVVLHHQSLENPIVVPLLSLEDLNANVILGHVENVMKSQHHLALDDSFHVEIGLIDMPKGGHNITNVSESVKLKRSIVEITNTDYLCLARAPSVCFAKAHQVSKMAWEDLLKVDPLDQCQCHHLSLSVPSQKNMHMAHLALEHKKCPPTLYTNLRKHHNQQTMFAHLLCDRAGVSKDRMASLTDIPKLEAVLGCQILVISTELGNKFITKGVKDDRKQLFVYLVNDNHFHAIPNISGFFTRSYFCHHCLTPFSNKEQHECDNYCRVCKRKSCKANDSAKTCDDCHMQCRSEDCFMAHKQPKKGDLPSECETYWRCPQCFKVLNIWQNKDGQHDCDTYICQPCGKRVPMDHQCYHTPIYIYG